MAIQRDRDAAIEQQIDAVIGFWFDELAPEDWWNPDDRIDAVIRERFAATRRAAICGELYEWRTGPAGRLAEIIVIDQFSRNLFRNSPEAFANDAVAVVLAQEAIAAGADQALRPQQRCFIYMPLMHSESRRLQAVSLELFAQPGLEENLVYARKHAAIIERFGRYPHRNAVLGRESTTAELAFLEQPGSSF